MQNITGQRCIYDSRECETASRAPIDAVQLVRAVSFPSTIYKRRSRVVFCTSRRGEETLRVDSTVIHNASTLRWRNTINVKGMQWCVYTTPMNDIVETRYINIQRSWEGSLTPDI